MKKFKIKQVSIFTFTIFSFAYYVWLRIQHIAQIRSPRDFFDTYEYLEIASRPLSSIAFWVASRPPVTPLFFKLLGGDFERIMYFQLWISIISWGILGMVLAIIVQNYWLKIFAFIFILAFSLTQNVILWDALILSDSLSLSLLALFLASSFLLINKWSIWRFIALVIVSTMMAFIRDTYAFFFLMAGGMLIFSLFLTVRRTPIFLVSGTFFILFVVVNIFSGIGMRWYMPLMMTMGLRILPNPEYVAYFEKRGMPVYPELMERAGKPIQADDGAMYYDPDLEEFRRWVRANGYREFTRFLWFFKSDTFQNPLRDLDQIFNPDVYYYAATGYRPIIKDQRMGELIYPFRFGLVASLFANAFAFFLLFPAIRYRAAKWAIPLVMILLSYPQAVLVWNADANDIARHSIYHVIMLRLGFWLLVLFLIDHLPVLINPLFGRKISHA